jgi:hypothetical protein
VPAAKGTIEMIGWRLVLPVVVAAAAMAAFITYFVSELAHLESNYQAPLRLPDPSVREPVASKGNDQRVTEDEKAIAEFRQAAEAILRAAPNSRAAAVKDVSLISGKIPLPKRRPIARK